MKLTRLEFTQMFPQDRETLWKFISNPSNLAKITPPEMAFKTLSGEAENMYAGQVITYTIKPLFGIEMDWVTEITHVKDREYFVDEQRFGPYSFWHHQHFLEDIDGGVKMTDILHYGLPVGILGKAVAGSLVRKKVEAIFEFRRKVLADRFGSL